MNLLMNRKFSEWTEGLDTRQAMVSVFNHIRDIPYAPVTDPNFHDLFRAGELILAEGRGSCAPKHYLLASMFRMLNLHVVYATFPFLWNDPKIHYPPALRQLAVMLPVAYHLACRVQVGCRWVLVDATWDPPLAKAGFPVNVHWDGYSDTLCAVTPLKAPVRTAFCRTATSGPCRDPDDAEFCPADGEKDHWDAGDWARYYAERAGMRTPADNERIDRFYRELDAWLDETRNMD